MKFTELLQRLLGLNIQAAKVDKEIKGRLATHRVLVNIPWSLTPTITMRVI